MRLDARSIPDPWAWTVWDCQARAPLSRVVWVDDERQAYGQETGRLVGFEREIVTHPARVLIDAEARVVYLNPAVELDALRAEREAVA